MAFSESDYQQMLRRVEAAKRKAHGAAQGSEPEQAVRDEPVGTPQGETSHASRFLVRITSFRCRLIDPDNICPKYFIDCLRYAGCIPDDRSDDITLAIEQVKVESRTDEGTELVVEPITENKTQNL